MEQSCAGRTSERQRRSPTRPPSALRGRAQAPPPQSGCGQPGNEVYRGPATYDGWSQPILSYWSIKASQATASSARTVRMHANVSPSRDHLRATSSQRLAREGWKGAIGRASIGEQRSAIGKRRRSSVWQVARLRRRRRHRPRISQCAFYWRLAVTLGGSRLGRTWIGGLFASTPARHQREGRRGEGCERQERDDEGKDYGTHAHWLSRRVPAIFLDGSRATPSPLRDSRTQSEKRATRS